VQKLQDLYFVNNTEDLQKKYREAVEWFHKLMSTIDKENVERLIRRA
jgi:hypothetical protein